MLELIFDSIGAFFIVGGAVFCIIGAIGLIRFPDFYSRCHAAGVTDSAGAGGILFGLCFVSEPLVIVKLLCVLAFLWMSSVASTHALVKAAYARGVRVEQPQLEDWTHGSRPPRDPGEEDRPDEGTNEPPTSSLASEDMEVS